MTETRQKYYPSPVRKGQKNNKRKGLIMENQEKRILKGFEIVEAESRTGNVFYKLVVKTQKDKECALFLSENQKEVIDLVGEANCWVDVEQRKSAENKTYNVIALHVADEEVFDFFVKDRAFITLAKLHAKNA